MSFVSYQQRYRRLLFLYKQFQLRYYAKLKHEVTHKSCDEI